MRFYSGVLTALWAGFGVLILVLAGWLEPLEGDLTRIGGYSENRFGWQQPQQRFPRNYTAYSQQQDTLPAAPDVLVYGDSFSHMGVHDARFFGWQNFLFQQTGLSIYTYHYGDLSLDDVLEKIEAGTVRPGVLVFQFVERGLLRWARRASYCDASKPLAKNEAAEAPPAPAALMMQPQAHVHTTPWMRDLQGGWQWDQAGQLLRAKLLKDEVRRFALSRADLFSHRAGDQLLVLETDTRKEGYTAAELEALRCTLAGLAARVEATGSRFVFLPAPDKLSLYVPEIGQPQFQTFLDQPDWPVVTVPAYPVLRALVEQGVQDVYLPNDTHWGWRANQAIAQALTDTLVAAGWLQPAVQQEGDDAGR